MRNYSCPHRYECPDHGMDRCNHCDEMYSSFWKSDASNIKPKKKMILVGADHRGRAFNYMNDTISNLTESKVDITYIDHDQIRFETAHTKVWFIFSVGQLRNLDGIRADAVFREAFPEIELRMTTTGGIISRSKYCVDLKGLVDYICQVEREASESKKVWITTAGDLSPFYRHMMNSLYGKFPEQPGYYLNANRSIVPEMAFMLGRRNGKSWTTAQWVQAVFDEAVKNGTVKTSLTKFRDISSEDIEQILKQGADHLIQQKLYAALMKGENTMPTKEEVIYIRKDVENTARLVAAMREVQDRNNRPKLPGIKTVHFSGPVTAVIWEDKTKTIVRCKDGEEPDYEKGLAMAIAKKALGTNKSGSNYYDIFKKWLPKPVEVEEVAIEEPIEREG